MTSLLDTALSIVAPHICKGCGVVGSTLCERCIYNTLRRPYRHCVYCNYSTPSSAVCKKCHKRSINQLDDIIAVGERSGALQRLIGDYKFHSERESAAILAGLLMSAIPSTWDFQQIAYIPTIDNHIRTRGFDHMKLVADELSRYYHKPISQLLVRTNNHTQHGANYIDRKTKIKHSLAIHNTNTSPRSVLLVDDIWTTGSTLNTAAALLRKIGVEHVYAAVIAVQPKHSNKKNKRR